MRIRVVVVILIFLILGISNWNYGQDSNTVYYKLWMEAPTTGLNTQIHKGFFKEGQGFIIPEFDLPKTWVADYSKYQGLYDVLVGGYFSIDYDAINKDLLLEMFIRNLDRKTGKYKTKGEDGDTLFAYFEMRVWELPDSTYSPEHLELLPDSSSFSEDSSYYFNKGKYARLTLPKTEKFFSFLDNIGIARDDSLSFAFMQQEDWDSNGVKTNDWNGDGIKVIDSQDSITFKAIHLSKVGGGRGRIHKNRDVNEDPTGVKNNLKVPRDFKLEQNYPNPFNPATKIRYSIPNSLRDKNTFVRLSVYNVLGVKVKTLVNENQSAGNYEVSFDASGLASGIYIYALQNNNIILTKKMMIIK